MSTNSLDSNNKLTLFASNVLILYFKINFNSMGLRIQFQYSWKIHYNRWVL